VSWFFLTLSVESLHRLRNVIFEHRLYLPMVGVSIFFSAGACLLFEERKKVIVACSVPILIFSVATYRRNEVWRDGVRLWQDVVKKSPESARSYKNLGFAYLEGGRYDDAIASCRKAIELDPADAKVYNNIGLAYGKQGRYDDAIASCRKAIELDPTYAKAYNNLGIAYGEKGHAEKEIEYYQKAIELDPAYPQAYGNLGSAYLERGEYDRAIAAYQKAIQLDPDYVKAHSNLAMAYLAKKDKTGLTRQVERLKKLGRRDLAEELEKNVNSGLNKNGD